MMLYIMLAYLMLFAALFNAVCLHNAYFLPSTFANALSWVIDTVCSFQILSCIMHSDFNLLFILILCSHRFLARWQCALWRIELKNKHSWYFFQYYCSNQRLHRNDFYLGNSNRLQKT